MTLAGRVAVDTFQVIRSTTPDVSYATDYQDVRELKKLADDLGISILLVHHLRKQGAADPLNKLSGTTGIAGAVDAVLVLEKSDRCQSWAALITAKKLKQLMNKWRYELEAQGVVFESRRSNGQRFVEVSLSALGSDASDSSDATAGALITCVPCDPVAAHVAAGAHKRLKVAPVDTSQSN